MVTHVISRQPCNLIGRARLSLSCGEAAGVGMAVVCALDFDIDGWRELLQCSCRLRLCRRPTFIWDGAVVLSRAARH